MGPNSSGWWTDERVDATVTSQYVHSHLRPNEAEQLTKSVFGDLSDDTYLEWILTRAKRFFLTLVDAGVPDQIFGVIDDSWDDEDLPIPEDEVPGLLLSAEPDKTLDRRFYKAQFKYLIRVIGDGEHIRYAQEETIPVNAIGSKPVIGKSKDAFDKVKLPSNSSRVFARKRVVLKNRHMEEELLAEMAEWRTFAHEHILSIFGSYTTEDDLYILLTPAPVYNLKSFLTDPPKAFDDLPKLDRRQKLLQWPHCLASGLAWLHKNTKHHGAIRPSRIQIDERFRICLGQFDGNGILCDSTVKDDIEAYQYAAPERWKRSVTVQATGNARVALPSGGRTGRRLTLETERTTSASRSDGHSTSSSQKLNIARPTSVSYAFSPTSKNGTRLRLGSTKNAINRIGSSRRQTESRQSGHMTDGMRPTRTSLEAHARPGATSVLSSNSNESALPRRQTGPIFAATPEMRTAVVQTWASAQHDQLAADIFSLGAIMLDILTILCKHSYSSFARHRATKNKSAGRGGGLADASFHANIGQVFTWAQTLQKDAEKRIKKEDGDIFKAVGPSLQVVLQCLEREPTDRLSAVELEKKLCEHMRDFARLGIPQCCLEDDIDGSDNKPVARRASADMLRQHATSRQQARRSESRAMSRSEIRPSEKQGLSAITPRIESLKVSPTNFNSFDFEIDNTPRTPLAELSSEDQPRANRSAVRVQPRPDSFAFTTGEGVEVFPRPPTANSRLGPTRSEAGDQSMATTPVSAVPRSGLPTFSTTASVAGSTVGEDFHSVYSYTPPPSAHPTRDLPPIPRSSSLKTAALTSNPYPVRSASKKVQLPIMESEPTALPALPSIDRQAISNLHSGGNGYSRHQSKRMSARMEDVDEMTPISPVESYPSTNTRHYRAPSRTGMADNRVYMSQLSRDQLALRGLQYP